MESYTNKTLPPEIKTFLYNFSHISGARRASGDGGGVTAKKQDSSQALSDRLNQLSVIKNISASKTKHIVVHFSQQEEKEQTFMLKTTTDCEQTV